ncbi:hypothetical protein F5Y04DRAFT_105584 [Hypomontagnella monticulosa]|nr:hypothetical protein F5Y04DRAFT_105584 [Hypomontagnella monticulosa]
MTVDSLKALIANIPDWLKRLEELNGQIEQRQLDLAMLPENRPKSSARSVRNQGSTESLKPKDDAPAHQPDVARPSTPPPPARNDTRQQDGTEAPSSPVSEPRSTTSLQRQTHEVMAAAQRRARATLRKRQKTDSMVSNENNISRYRSRNMIIVYYDSYVQSFFEELVKFVSMQRNSMRRAKMAAKVAHIRRLAELEIPDDDEDDGGGGGSGELKPSNDLIAADTNLTASDSKTDEPMIPKLQYVSTRRMGPRNLAAGRMSMRVSQCGLNGGLGSIQDGKRDVWEELDKSLEFVQGMCEHGAHQFLRDGDCSDEVEKIKVRLAQTKVTADKELARALEESPNDTPSVTPIKSRSFRPTTMRRGVMNASPSKSPPPPKQEALEIEDEGVQDMDDFQPADKPTGQTNGPSS